MTSQLTTADVATALGALRLPTLFTRDRDEKEAYLLATAIGVDHSIQAGTAVYVHYIRRFLAGWLQRFPPLVRAGASAATVQTIRNREMRAAFDELSLRVDLWRALHRCTRIQLPPGLIVNPPAISVPATGTQPPAPAPAPAPAPPLPVLFLPPVIHNPHPASNIPPSSHTLFIPYNGAQDTFGPATVHPVAGQPRTNGSLNNVGGPSNTHRS